MISDKLGTGNFFTISPSKSPEAEVTPSLYEEYKEYEFTADNLGEFDGYVIKVVMSSTNQAEPVKIRDIRTIAVK